jgi:hypothetical protein
MRNSFYAAVAVSLLGFHANSKEQPAPVDAWAAYRFLLGEWVGEGEGQPGQGKGQFSFAPDLQGKVLVRKNRADYAASGGRPAFTHEDLMIVYQEGNDKTQKAIYFDSEGHVVQYAVRASEDGQTLTFLSDAKPSLPRYRLTYAKREAGKVTVKFEMASPDKPEAFKTYLEGTVRKK